MSHFIQNTGENSLSQIINNLLPSKTKAMDFLVGYFYFSGIQEIYKNIDDNKIGNVIILDGVDEKEVGKMLTEYISRKFWRTESCERLI